VISASSRAGSRRRAFGQLVDIAAGEAMHVYDIDTKSAQMIEHTGEGALIGKWPMDDGLVELSRVQRGEG
jgi:hypothetical protein